jgi:hypothetical protein
MAILLLKIVTHSSKLSYTFSRTYMRLNLDSYTALISKKEDILASWIDLRKQHVLYQPISGLFINLTTSKTGDDGRYVHNHGESYC